MGSRTSPDFTGCVSEEPKQSLVVALPGGPRRGADTVIGGWRQKGAGPAFHLSLQANCRRGCPRLQLWPLSSCLGGRGWGGPDENLLNALLCGSRSLPAPRAPAAGPARGSPPAPRCSKWQGGVARAAAECCGRARRGSARIQGGLCGPPPPSPARLGLLLLPEQSCGAEKPTAGDAISVPTQSPPRKSQSPSLRAALPAAGRNCLGWESPSAERSHFLPSFLLTV